MKRLLFVGILFTQALQGTASKHAESLRKIQPRDDQGGYAGRPVTFDHEEDRLKFQEAVSAKSITPAHFDLYCRMLEKDPTIKFRDEETRERYLIALSFLAEEQGKTATQQPTPKTLTVDLTQGATLSTDDPADLFGNDDKLPIQEDLETHAFNWGNWGEIPKMTVEEAQAIIKEHKRTQKAAEIEARARKKYLDEQAEIAANSERGQYLKRKAERKELEEKKQHRREMEKEYCPFSDDSWDAYWAQYQKDMKDPAYLKLFHEFDTDPQTEKELNIWDLNRRQKFLKPADDSWKVAIPQQKPAAAPVEEKKQPTEMEIAFAKAQAEYDKAVREEAEARAKLDAAIREPVVVTPRQPSAKVLALREELAEAKKDALASDAGVRAARQAYENAKEAYAIAHEHCEKLNTEEKKSAWQQAKALLATIPGFFTTHKEQDVEEDFYAALNHKKAEGLGARMMRYVKRGFCDAAAVGVVTCILIVGAELRRDPKQSVATILKTIVRSINTDIIPATGFLTAVGGYTEAVKDAFHALYEWSRGSDFRPGIASRYISSAIASPLILVGTTLGCMTIFASVEHGLTHGLKLLATSTCKFAKNGRLFLAGMSGVTTLGQAIYDLASLCYTKATERFAHLNQRVYGAPIIRHTGADLMEPDEGRDDWY